jgi:hypothetical protein
MATEKVYEAIEAELTSKKEVSAGNLFGKACVKLGTKALVAFHKNEMVFKLTAADQKEIIALKGAHLWDPSGSGRPMKEWTCLPEVHAKKWPELAGQALKYAKALAAKK